MKILALETSARAVSSAVSEDGKILACNYQDTGLTHSRTLMPMVEDLIRDSGLNKQELDIIAAAAGPGSFTGIRIGIAAAKGLAFGLDKPALGVSTLAAMARNIAFADGLIICAMDARRSQVYNALFESRDGKLTRLTQDRAVSLQDLARELAEDRRFDCDLKMTVGDGAALCAEYLLSQKISCRIAPPRLVMQNAASVALEAESMAAEILSAAGVLPTARDLRPVYLRPPHAIPPKMPNRI